MVQTGPIMTTTDITEPETKQLERYAGEATTEGTVKEMLANLATGATSATAEERRNDE